MPTKRNFTQEPVARKRRGSFAALPVPDAVSYFASSSQRAAGGIEFVSLGCELLDQVIGGGMVLGRMINIVGDKSSGKTLLAIEACANFKRQYPTGFIRYAEAEAAFDLGYAEALGMPVESIEFADFLKPKKKAVKRKASEVEEEDTDDIEDETDRTVEYLFEDIKRTLRILKGRPCLYIVDSLDALSDRVEKAKKADEGSYGMQKAKKLHELFRVLNGEIEASRMIFLIISQIKDKIGVTFGETKQRTGGHSLDFFASQVVWLAQIEKIWKTIDDIKRAVGVQVKATCKKNKIGLPFRECEFPILFGYGVDDVMASAQWLIDNGLDGRLAEVEMSKSGYKLRIQKLRDKGGFEMSAVRSKLNTIVRQEWERIEMTFLPRSRKY